jgi:hypothetical protein
MEGRGEEGQGRKRGKGREEGGEGMIRNDRPSPHQKILDPPLPLWIGTNCGMGMYVISCAK